MAKKRKRQPARPLRTSQGRTPKGTRATGAEPGRRRPSNRGRTTEGAKASRAPARPTRSRRAPAGPQLRLPPFLPTFSRGLLGVGSNPLILPSAFLGALAVWGIYASFRSVRVLTPSELAQILALPPIHSLLDLRLIFGGGSPRSAVGTLALAGLLLLVRAALFAFLIALSFETLGGDGTEPPGYRPALRRAATRTATSLGPLFLLEVTFLAMLSFVGGLIQSFLGLLGLALVLAVEVYYLVFAPVITVVEGVGLSDAVALSLRLVRRSSRQSILFASGYVLLTLFFLVIQSPFASATPSIQVWAYVLFMTFIHVSVLTTVMLRWLAVRGEGREGWTARGTRRRLFPSLGTAAGRTS